MNSLDDNDAAPRLNKRQARRRHTLCTLHEDQHSDENLFSNSPFLQRQQDQLSRNYRRFSVAMTNLSRRDSIQMAVTAVIKGMVTVCQTMKKWFMIAVTYTWNIVCLNYAAVSERADLEGRSAIG